MPQRGLLAIMTAMSEEVPAVLSGDAAAELAWFMNEFYDQLSDEQAVVLMMLGAGLWRRGVELGDTPSTLVAELSLRH